MNEALFREVNERIDQLHDQLGSGRAFEVVCECGDAECTERFQITSQAYSELREDVHRFAVVPGHEQPDVERTIAKHDRYFVVEKTDPKAAEAAETTA
jgi:hypothetical protein